MRDWFTGLEADNSRAYCAAQREVFDGQIRGQMEALLEQLSNTFGGQVKIFRQNRDIRFSRDKSPYKTNTCGILRGTELARLGLYASSSEPESLPPTAAADRRPRAAAAGIIRSVTARA